MHTALQPSLLTRGMCASPTLSQPSSHQHKPVRPWDPCDPGTPATLGVGAVHAGWRRGVWGGMQAGRVEPRLVHLNHFPPGAGTEEDAAGA